MPRPEPEPEKTSPVDDAIEAQDLEERSRHVDVVLERFRKAVDEFEEAVWNQGATPPPTSSSKTKRADSVACSESTRSGKAHKLRF